jgi:hypothetical protein
LSVIELVVEVKCPGGLRLGFGGGLGLFGSLLVAMEDFAGGFGAVLSVVGGEFRAVTEFLEFLAASLLQFVVLVLVVLSALVVVFD